MTDDVASSNPMTPGGAAIFKELYVVENTKVTEKSDLEQVETEY